MRFLRSKAKQLEGELTIIKDQFDRTVRDLTDEVTTLRADVESRAVYIIRERDGPVVPFHAFTNANAAQESIDNYFSRNGKEYEIMRFNLRESAI